MLYKYIAGKCIKSLFFVLQIMVDKYQSLHSQIWCCWLDEINSFQLHGYYCCWKIITPLPKRKCPLPPNHNRRLLIYCKREGVLICSSWRWIKGDQYDMDWVRGHRTVSKVIGGCLVQARMRSAVNIRVGYHGNRVDHWDGWKQTVISK